MCDTFHIQFVRSATWKFLYTQCRHGKMKRLGIRMLVFLLFITWSAAHWYRQLGLQGQTYWRQRTANILHVNWVQPHILRQLTPYNHMWSSCIHICLHGKWRNNFTFTYGTLKEDFTLLWNISQPWVDANWICDEDSHVADTKLYIWTDHG